MSGGPLEGVRVVDLTSVVVGPLCTQILADHGAEIIKVENKTGDLIRFMNGKSVTTGMGAKFLHLNRNKRSVVLDLKQAADLDTLRALVRNADVLVHNFRPSVPPRLGIGYDQLRAVNPRLIYCAVSGYGDTGPLAEKAGYDQVLQTMTGMCAMQGKKEGPPEVLYGSIVDYYASAMVAAGVSSALYEREKSGAGQEVGISLLAAALTLQSARLVWADNEPRDVGRDMRSGGITGIHPTGDGYLYISANTPHFWKALCAKVGLDALAANERYDTVRKRAAHQSEIVPQLHAALKARTALQWEAIFGEEVPCAAARTVEDMFDHPQVQSQDMITHFEHPVVGGYRGLKRTIRFGRTPGPHPFAAPTLGQHTDLVRAFASGATPAPQTPETPA